MTLPNHNANEVNPYAARQSILQSPLLASFPTHVPHHFNWKLTVIAWVMFFGGVALLLAFEYICRKTQQKNELAIPNEILSVIIIILGITSLYCLWVATNSQQHWLLRIVIVSVQGVIAYLLFVFLVLSYLLFLSDLPFKMI